MSDAPDKLLFAPKIWNRVRMEEETNKEEEEIEAAIEKMAGDDAVSAMSLPVGRGADNRVQEVVEDIPPERKKPIPYAVAPDRLERIVLDTLPSLKFRRTDIQAIVAGSYLTAGRIKENLQIRASDVEIREQNGKEYLFFNMMTEKKRMRKKNVDGVMVKVKPIPPRRSVPVPLVGGIENKLVKIFMEHYHKFSGEEFLFCLSEEEAVLIDRTNSENRLLENERCLAHYYFHKIDFGPIKVMKYYPNRGYVVEVADTYMGFPHYMRHVRLTHLSTIYQLPDQMLMNVAGWSSTKMATNYVHLDGSDVAARIGERLNNMQRA